LVVQWSIRGVVIDGWAGCRDFIAEIKVKFRLTLPHPGMAETAAEAASGRLPPLKCRFRPRPVNHAFEFHAVRIEKIDRVVGAVVLLAGRVDNRHAMLHEECAERVDVLTARQLERIMMEADVALAVLALAPLRIGLRDPERRLAVAPAGRVVFEPEAEKAQHLAVEVFRARKMPATRGMARLREGNADRCLRFRRARA
jgi:hypothetical protein